MKKVEKFLPKDKHDTGCIRGLEELSAEEIKPVLPELLSWVQDMNWPVAPGVCEVLARNQEHVISMVRKILIPEELDETWKYWIIRAPLPLFSEENLKALYPELRRIASAPTEGERREGVDEAAHDLLKKLHRLS